MFKPHTAIIESLDSLECSQGAFIYINNILAEDPRYAKEKHPSRYEGQLVRSGEVLARRRDDGRLHDFAAGVVPRAGFQACRRHAARNGDIRQPGVSRAEADDPAFRERSAGRTFRQSAERGPCGRLVALDGRAGDEGGHIPSGSYIQPVDWDSSGLECDKMNPEAVSFHLDHVIAQWKKHLGPDLWNWRAECECTGRVTWRRQGSDSSLAEKFCSRRGDVDKKKML